VKFIDVDLSSVDELGSIEEYASSLDDVGKAMQRIADTIQERIQVTGEIFEIDGKDVFINLGKADQVIEGNEVIIRRPGKPILDPNDGKVVGFKPGKELGRGKITGVQNLISQLQFVGVANPAKIADLQKKDVVQVIPDDKLKKSKAENYAKMARGYMQGKSYNEARSAIDNALNYYPNNGEYLALKKSIDDQMTEDLVRSADAKDKARLLKEQADANRYAQKSQSSSSSSYRSSSSSSSSSTSSVFRDGGLQVGANYYLPTSINFAKYFSGLGGASVGILLPKNILAFTADYYFLLNDANPATVVVPYKTMRANMLDVHGVLNITPFEGWFIPYIGGGLFYRYFYVTVEDPSLASKVSTTHWGIGAEALLGLMITFGDVALNLRGGYNYVLINTLNLGSSGATSSADKALAALAETGAAAADARLGLSGYNFSANLVFRLK
jgi:hypothetical protein